MNIYLMQSPQGSWQVSNIHAIFYPKSIMIQHQSSIYRNEPYYTSWRNSNNYLMKFIKCMLIFNSDLILRHKSTLHQTHYKNQQMNQEKQSHQVRALLLKNIKIQSRQPCTNICQIITPVICLVFSILIRNIAISKIPTDSDSIFNQFPTIPQKFNDYTLQDLFPKLVKRVCSQWYSYEVKNERDNAFIGIKDGSSNKGLLGRIPHTYSKQCDFNISKTPPFVKKSWMPPVFLHENKSVNVDIFDSIEYLNNLNNNDLRNTTALDKLPDGSITFYQANHSKLLANLKINDLRLLDYHRADGVTRIRFYNNKSDGFQSYYLISQGFLSLQHAITSAYTEQVTQKKSESGYIYMPFKPNSSVFVDILVNTVTTVIFPISLSLLLPVFLYLIVLQKQQKLIQMMRMNGMKMKNYWFVNFMFSFVISILTNAVFVIFGYLFMDNALFHQTGKDVLFVVLLGWILAQIGMATFFQVFLASSRAANIIGYLISIWTNLIGATLSIAIYQYPRPMPMYFKWYPTFAFNRMFYLMFTQCSADRCYSSLGSLTQQAKHCILILYISFIIFQLLGMYLFEVVPQQYGTRQPLSFPFKFITGKFRKNSNQSLNITQVSGKSKQNNDQSAKGQRSKISDVVNISDYPLIISDLRKVYSNGKVAVKGLDLLLHDKQVFGLLGPNGAGKTTLISMITGVFECSNGDCYVAGHSIKTQIEKVHLNIGVCPQFDILWPQLTVEEHLYFYTRLRGTKKSEEKMMVDKTLEEVNLTQFRRFKANQLSGGMKRRLSVGISMVGEPRIVFLDEPTTGLDPENRRNLWDVLNKCRQNRALFLTTHLMEQADALCNRVGIITKGVLRTVGTQQKLKQTYGNGYYLSLNLPLQKMRGERQNPDLEEGYDNQQEFESVKNSVMSVGEQLTGRTFLNQTLVQQKISKTRVDSIKNAIYEMFPNAILDRQISGYLRFNLGNIVISQIMRKLGNSDIHDIRNNWGLTNSNLEDVFLGVVRKFDKQDEEDQERQEEDLDIPESISKAESLMTEEQIDRHSIHS